MKAAREKRWVVREGDGTTVAEILTRAKEPASAVDEGRVFVGRIRVKRAEQTVKPGDEVRIGAGAEASARPVAGAGARVIWNRDGIIACEKPAGMPTVADHAGSAHTLVAFAAASVGRNVGELIITSRLDREVSGVVLFATAESELRLRRAREEGRYVRRYVAIAPDFTARGEGAASGKWDAPIGGGKDPRHRAAFGPDAKEASTHFAVVAKAGGFCLLAVEPQTGRTHQIRVHAAHAGAPLLGDRDYGGAGRVTRAGGSVVALPRIALHAARVRIVKKAEPHADAQAHAEAEAMAEVPREMRGIWSALGGDEEAWDTALSCEV